MLKPESPAQRLFGKFGIVGGYISTARQPICRKRSISYRCGKAYSARGVTDKTGKAHQLTDDLISSVGAGHGVYLVDYNVPKV